MDTKETPVSKQLTNDCAPIISSQPGGPLVCYPVRLRPGEEVTQTLLKYVEDRRIEAAFILSCVGSVTEVRLRMSDSTTIKHFTGPFEIVSLVGTLSEGGHLHGSFSDKTGSVFGGHVVDTMHVFTTAEVMIGVCTNAIFSREPDTQTGYNELVIKHRTS